MSVVVEVVAYHKHGGWPIYIYMFLVVEATKVEVECGGAKISRLGLLDFSMRCEIQLLLSVGMIPCTSGALWDGQDQTESSVQRVDNVCPNIEAAIRYEPFATRLPPIRHPFATQILTDACMLFLRVPLPRGKLCNVSSP